ncbi:MAG TPA: MoaD/ThiS family protein [bacterium]|nr:MoaD/ThiS family protein [bacterium]
MPTVRIPAPLRKLTGDQRVVQASGETLADLVADLERRFPGIKGRIMGADGQVHSFVNIFVDDQDVRFLQGLATPLREEAEIAIIPAMAGGMDPTQGSAGTS